MKLLSSALYSQPLESNLDELFPQPFILWLSSFENPVRVASYLDFHKLRRNLGRIEALAKAHFALFFERSLVEQARFAFSANRIIEPLSLPYATLTQTPPRASALSPLRKVDGTKLGIKIYRRVSVSGHFLFQGANDNFTRHYPSEKVRTDARDKISVFAFFTTFMDGQEESRKGGKVDKRQQI